MANGRNRLLRRLGPGLLIAATGVGAGDLATASFSGSQLGTAVLWAVVVGAGLKYVLTEGLARWQLVTGQTLLEGIARHVGPLAGWIFLPYLLLWSFFVGSALVSACGVTLHALWPVCGDPARGKIVFGILSSLSGLVMVWLGGYRLFEKVMGVCVALMVITVVLTAVLLWPGTGAVLRGLVIPTIPWAGGVGLTWTVALMGGVGGTLTILCYGYWIREEGRKTAGELPLCRLDLALGYLMTAVFGIAMVIVGSTVTIHGKGAGLLVVLADRLLIPLGPAGRLLFLVGALGAVFSSLLGVWQAVPYLFADVWRLFLHPGADPPKTTDPTAAGSGTRDGGDLSVPGRSTAAMTAAQPPPENAMQAVPATIDTHSLPYRLYLLALALVPLLGLFMGFRQVQKVYAVIGAAFIPLLAAILLVLNGRRVWVGRARNDKLTTAVLVAALILFAWLGTARWRG